MKNIKSFFLLPLAALLLFSSCQEDSDLMTGTASEGGLVEVQNALIN